MRFGKSRTINVAKFVFSNLYTGDYSCIMSYILITGIRVSTTDQMGEFDLAIKYMMMYP